MLVVKLEIWPGGDKDSRKTIGTMQIGNLSNLADVSDYGVRVLNEQGVKTAQGKVFGHARTDGAWALVLKSLEVLSREE